MANKKKCEKCGAPLAGFLFNTIGKIFGIKQSESDPKICNKCEQDGKKAEDTPKETVEEKAEESEQQTLDDDTEAEENNNGED